MDSLIAPCPFCESLDCEILPCKDGTVAVTCPRCGVRGPKATKPDIALAAWYSMPRSCDPANQKPRTDEQTIESEEGTA